MFTSVLESYRAAFRGLSRDVWLLAGLGLVNRCGSMVLPFLTLYLTSQQDFSPRDAGFLLATYGAGGMVGIELGGRATDRFGFRPVMLASLVLNGLGLFALGVVEGYEALLVAAFGVGLVAEAFRPATSVAIAVASRPENRLRAFGLYRLAINIGWTIGPAIGGFLAGHDYLWLFVIDGMTCIAAGVFLLRMRIEERGALPTEHEATNDVTSPWRDGMYVLFLVLLLGQAAIFFQMQSTFSLYLAEHQGLEEWNIGLLLSINTLVIVAFEMVLMHRIETRNPLRVLAVAGLFTGVGFGLLPFGGGVWFVAFTILVWTFGEMLGAPVGQVWVMNRAPHGSRGRYMAGFGLCFSLASVVAPLAGTALYEDVSPDAVWYACLGMGAVQWLGFRALARFEQRRERP